MLSRKSKITSFGWVELQLWFKLVTAICSLEIVLCRIMEVDREELCTYSVNKELTLYHLCNLTSLSWHHIHSHVTSSMILLMHSWNLLMHMHTIGAAEEILGEGEPKVYHLPECSNHQPATFMNGKPRSIISLPILLMSPKLLVLLHYVIGVVWKHLLHITFPCPEISILNPI